MSPGLCIIKMADYVVVPPFMVAKFAEHMRKHVRVLYNRVVYNTRLNEDDVFIGTNVGLASNLDTVPVLLPREEVESVRMTGYTEVDERYMRYSRRRPGRFFVYAYDPIYEEYLYSLAFYGYMLQLYNNFTGHFEQRQYEAGFRYYIETSEYEDMLPSFYQMARKVLTDARPGLQFTELGNPASQFDS